MKENSRAFICGSFWTRIFADSTDAHGFDPRKSVESVSIRVPRNGALSKGVVRFEQEGNMLRNRVQKSFIGIVFALAAQVPLLAQGLEYVKANYTKHEHHIPMRDGVRLYTAVYIPKDRSQVYPMLLSRTPYSISPYGTDGYRNDIGP